MMPGGRWLLVATFAAQAALAQTTVYESKDKAGPVFSDKPSAGATAVDVPPPNVIAGPKPAPTTAPPAAAVAPAYQTLAIVSPVNEATLHTNTGEIDLSARLNPALRPNDRLRVKLDGKVLPGAYRSTRLRITAADWQAAASPASVEHSLQLAVVDAQGGVLIESAPVRIYVHRASVAGQR